MKKLRFILLVSLLNFSLYPMNLVKLVSDKYYETKLMDSAKNGNIQDLKSCLEHEINFDIRDKENFTALMHSAKNNHIENVKALINYCEINARNSEGQTALHLAVNNCHIAIIQLLIEYSKIVKNINDFSFNEIKKKNFEATDINARDNNGNTPLMLAITNNFIEISELLLEQSNVEVNSKTKDYGYTPLMLAIRQKQEAIVKILLQNPKLDINAVSNIGSTAIMFAAQYNCVKILELLIKHPSIKINIKNNEGWSAFRYAVLNNNIDVVKFFIDKTNCDINSRDNGGISALIVAVAKNYTKLLKILIDKSNVSWQTGNNNRHVFWYAWENENFESIKLISEVVYAVEFSKIINWQNVNGILVKAIMLGQEAAHGIFKAIDNKDLAQLEEIIKNNFTLNIKDHKGNCPLHYAIINQDIEIIKFILKHNSDLKKIINKNGKSPVDIAKENNNEEILKIIESYKTDN